MENEKQRFVFYEYLTFFWQKKWIFLIIPLVLIGLAAVYSFMQDLPYKGKALVYVGDINDLELTDPEILNNNENYLNETTLNFNAYVSGTDQLTFTLSGADSKEVEEQLNTIVNLYLNDLEAEAEFRKDSTTKRAEFIEQEVKSLEDLIEKLHKKDAQGGLTEEEELQLLEQANLIIENRDKAERMKQDVDLYKDPKIIAQTTTKPSPNLKGNMIAGGLAGLILSLLILVLWKYIIYAREMTRK